MRKTVIITLLLSCFLMCAGTSALASQSTYIVKKGDSLWNISQSTGVSINTIKSLNSLKSNNLSIGQKLILSSNSTAQTVKPQTVAAVASNDSNYTVASGDSLWSIANKFKTTVQIIKQNNNLTSDVLHVGDKLKVSGAVSAPAVPVVPAAPVVASRSGDSGTNGDEVIKKAAEYLGTPYRYGGSTPKGFDCSGFSSYIYSQFNINLPRTAASQYGSGISVAKADLVSGDLVFFACTGKGIDHVGIYCGGNKFIHSSSPRSGGVIYSTLSESYYAKSYVGARRVIR